MPENLRDKIRAAEDIKSEMVEVPEWDVTVEVRTISGARRADIFSGATDSDGKIVASNAYTALVVAASYDPENGKPLFNKEDADWLKDKSAKAVERVARVASRLAGLGEDSFKDAEKN